MDESPAIRDSRLFDGLDAAARRAWLETATRRELRRGTTLSRQGDPAQALYLVEAGLLKLVQGTPAGRAVIVRFVGPGEPFGGVVALEGGQYPVTATAAAPTRLYAWPRQTLARLLERDPQVRANITREIAAHMNDALTRVRELTTERVGQRLARTLLRLMHQCGRPVADGVLIAHALTRQELAELAGTTLYTASRTLSQWQADGILGSAGRRLVVRSPRRLETLAQAAADD
jgi:CRP-like cAMP-binding protein